ncbi:MAG: CDP-glycerol glycerophosphotransferase family protein [Lachnospiraceae bacterium]|nr:CDP-glycerol glycerophosphotransferase family protein [Lachnospiraceae bacterium]
MARGRLKKCQRKGSTHKMDKEQRYIQKRIWKARLQSILFYVCRLFPVRERKIVFCCIEGTTGYSCNPKYIAEELIRRNAGYEMVWLVNDISRKFPKEIRAVRNTLWNRAYHLTTAHFWIDNSRKQLEARKRRGQIYIQTWHAKLGFKPTCLDRGASFSRIAYLVSKHDSDMIDYVLSNSKWYDDTLPTGMIYQGPVLRTGSPRCDILVSGREEGKRRVRERYGLAEDVRIIMYAPTFRGGSQGTDRTVEVSQGFPDYQRLSGALEKRFGGKWCVFLRLHPQLVARNLDLRMADALPSDGGRMPVNESKTGQMSGNESMTGRMSGNESKAGQDSEDGKREPEMQNIEAQKLGVPEYRQVIDVSRVDDMYEILAGCDAFLTDYSSAAFDAAVMKVPVFLYTDDYEDYERERGKLLWDLRKLPFPLALHDEELECRILEFDEADYREKLERLFRETEMVEDGKAAERVVDMIENCIIV